VGKLNKSYRFVLQGLIGSVLIVALLGLVQRLTGRFIFAEHEWIQGRISAFYNSANALALFIGPIIPIIATFFFAVKKKWQKIGFLGLLLFLSLIMYWTKSKGGMMAEVFSLGIVVYGIISVRLRLLRKLWILVPIIFLLMSIGFFVQVYRIYNPIIQSPTAKIEDDTLQIRYATWFSTSKILSGEFVLGTGLNGFKYVYDNYKLPAFQEDFQYPHNIFFNFWTETGLLGLVSFGVLIYYGFFVCMQLNRKKINLIILGLIGSFAYIVAHGLVDVPYFKNDLSLQFWSLLALTQLLKDQLKEYT
jgi:O-antigen ligase